MKSYSKKLNIDNSKMRLFLQYIFNVDKFIKENPNIDHLFKINNDVSTSVYGQIVVDYALFTKDMKLNVEDISKAANTAFPE